MFRFTQEPSSRSQSQCLAKITGMVPLCLSICALSVLWRQIPTCCAYVYTRTTGRNTWSVRKVSDRIFLCEHLMDYNLARLHEPTLNLSAHA